MTFYAAGGVYKDGIPLDLVRDPNTVLADMLNDEPLPPSTAGPCGSSSPTSSDTRASSGWSRQVTDAQVEGYWEQRGYPTDAPVT